MLASGLLLGAPLATLGRRELGDVGLWLGLLPIVLATPFALPWLDPPAEHGALKLLAFLAQKVVRNVTWRRLPPRHELAEADGLRAFVRVVNAYRSRETLGLSEQPELAGVRIAEGVVHVPIGRRTEVRAIYRVPTVNLDTASAETRRGARAKWGAVLNGLPHPIQVVIRGRPATTLPVVERIKAHGSPQARDLAAWLRAPPARRRARRTGPLPGRAGGRSGDAERPLREPGGVATAYRAANGADPGRRRAARLS